MTTWTAEIEDTARNVAQQICATGPLRLYAKDLESKWGFGDGDVLNALAAATGADRTALLSRAVDHAIVEPNVQRGAVVTLAYWGSAHNPVRVQAFNGLLTEAVGDRLEPYGELGVEDLVAVARAAIEEGPAPLRHVARAGVDTWREGEEALTSLLVGRGVEVELISGDDEGGVWGHFLAFDGVHYAIASGNFESPSITFVPAAQVRSLRVIDITEGEYARFFEPAEE